MLDGRQQVIGEHTKKDVSLGPVLELMKNRPSHQRISKRIFDRGQKDVEAPDFIPRQILPARLQYVAAIEFLRHRLLVGLLLPGTSIWQTTVAQYPRPSGHL